MQGTGGGGRAVGGEVGGAKSEDRHRLLGIGSKDRCRSNRFAHGILTVCTRAPAAPPTPPAPPPDPSPAAHTPTTNTRTGTANILMRHDKHQVGGGEVLKMRCKDPTNLGGWSMGNFAQGSGGFLMWETLTQHCENTSSSGCPELEVQ